MKTAHVKKLQSGKSKGKYRFMLFDGIRLLATSEVYPDLKECLNDMQDNFPDFEPRYDVKTGKKP
jgi:hypothetical protein